MSEPLPAENATPGPPTRKRSARFTGQASLWILAALAMLALPAPSARGADAPTARPAKAAADKPTSIAVSYADLIDASAVTRTGRRLGDALGDTRTPRAHLQPFLDGYSSLLPYVVEMVFGADPAPRRDILERWPPGSPQPAWVALFRGGKYRAVADGEGRVRLFLPGDDAAGAWRSHYPVVRHCLAALARPGGAPLSVEVFAYRNDYRKRELRLSLRPATVSASAFPPDRAPLDVTALDDFFRQGGRLEGAQLDPDEGLVLFANPEQRDTLAGAPVSLGDLAVAYRAVFHAGDNDAFVSLDPNADPSLATVNFGGYLEDTRVGAVVLAADRRFKTVCSGLDPVSHRDVRQEIRRQIPAFLTNSERGFLDRGAPTASVWVTTRYWFYPESISVDVDPAEGFAVITKPRFTADAERIGEGFESADARKKRAALPAVIRENIRSINAFYARYSAAFPEIGELAAVARLMAVSTWLERSDTSQIDLDALLGVELPAAPTPRVLERLISTEHIAVPPGEEVTEEMVRDRSGAFYLSPMLQRTVGDFFGNPKTFAAYLCIARKAQKRPCSAYEEEAAALFEARRDTPLRALLASDQDLMSLLEFLTTKIEYPLPPEGEAARAAEAADHEQLKRLTGELERVKREIDAGGETAAASLAGERERLEAEIGAIMKRYHEDRSPSSAWRVRSTIQVSGGISLRPDEFTIRATPSSPALQQFKKLARGASVEAKPGSGTARLVRSRPTGKIPKPAAAAAPSKPAPARPATGAAPSPPPAAPKPAAAGKAAPVAAPKAAPVPTAAPGPAREPTLVAKSIAIPAGAAGAARAVGELAADGRIVFRKAGP
jgi:hypothetical protein